MTHVLRGLEEVREAAGTDLGVTGWVEVGPDRVARFDAVLRGPRSGPPAMGVAADRLPPYLILSLTNLFMPELVVVEGVGMGVNYGTGEVRFPAPAPVPARLRCRGRITEVSGVAGGVQTTIRLTVEADGVSEPVCVADALSRWLE